MRSEESCRSISEFVLGELSPEESLRFLERVEHDPELSAKVEDCVMVMRVAGERGADVFSIERSGPWLVREGTSSARATGYAMKEAVSPRNLVMVTIMMLLLAVPWISERLSGPYSDVAVVTRVEVDVQVRGSDDGRLAGIDKLLHMGRHDEAIELLEGYVQVTSTPERRGYAAYLLGGAYLLSARRSYLGLFPTYDRDRVASGMGYLMEVVRTGGNGRLVDEAHWLRAKGYLMIGHPDAAVGEVSGILAEGGSKYAAAAALTAEIRRL